MATPNWPLVSIKDACISITDCVNKTAPTVDISTPYKMIRTTNVKAGWVNLNDVRYVSAEVFEAWTRRGRPMRGDVILTREAPLGEVGMLRSDETVFLGQRLVQYRANPECLDNRFLLYSLQSDFVQGQIRSAGSGATVEHMRVPDCESLVLPLPGLPLQRKIAGIISAYDDLIENNARRISILEEMARALFREWFVDFRFPGYESVEFVETPMGRMPAAWPPLPLSELVEVNPVTPAPNNVPKPFAMMACLSDNSMVIDRLGERTATSGSKFKNGDTLLARITPCLENGKTGFVQFLPTDNSVACGSTEFIVLRSKRLCPELVYCLARSNPLRDHAIKSMSGASGRQRVQVKCFDSFLLPAPDRKTVARFSDVATPLFRAVQVLHVKNTNLHQTRDLLLPKLISGEVDVSDLDIALTEDSP